jgi:hypothetical protein
VTCSMAHRTSSDWYNGPPTRNLGLFLACKRNEIERFEQFVTDWEFREYACHLRAQASILDSL